MNEVMLYTTEQAAAQLGITHIALLNWINRWPDYRPQLQMGKQSAWVWTPAEIERARMGRAETRKRKKDGDKLG